MSFDKKHLNRKDHRKQYRDSRRFDRTCRSHGSCSYCVGGRKHKQRRDEQDADIQIKEYEMRYNTLHIRKLRSEAAARFDEVLRVLRFPVGSDTVTINAVDIRLAVDDFKSILAEIRRLK